MSRAIESTLKQTWPNLEVILVENNSTDDTFQILNAYRERFSQKIWVLQEKGKGAASARNRGLLEADGQWIQFLDSDDELLPGKIERQMSLVRGTNFDLVGGSYYYAKAWKKLRKLVNHFSWAGLITSSLGITSANLWNRSSVLRVGGFKKEQQSSQEYERMFRMLKTDARVIVDDEPRTIVYHRQESLGKTSDKEKKSQIWCNLFDLRLDIRSYLEKQNLFSGKLRFVWENHMYSHLVHLEDQFPEVYMHYMPLLRHKLSWFHIAKSLIGCKLRKLEW